VKVSPYTVAWTLLGFLTAGAILISLGKKEVSTNPSLDSFAPSGLAAFGRLMSENGYSVSSTMTVMPSYLSTNDVLVVPLNETQGSTIDYDETGIGRQIARFLNKGGRVMLLRMSEDFAEVAPFLTASTVKNRVTGKSYKIHARAVNWSEKEPTGFTELRTSAVIWEQPSSDVGFGGLTRIGKGVAFSIQDGLIATNRYIDKGQNADVLTQSMMMIAPKGSHLLFLGSAFYDEAPSLVEILGPGATAGWLQIILCFFLIVFTLGKRFGLAEEPVQHQKGQRELVDAVAETYRRARSTRVACRAAYDRADQDVRRALKISSEVPASERDLRIPAALALEFRRVFEGSIDSLPAAEAFERCRALRRQARLFLQRER
jgi:hypothetical protein